MGNNTIKRRTLVKGAAWAAPALLAASSVPAYAASLCPGELVPSRRHGDEGTTNSDLGLLSFKRLSDTSFIGDTVNVGDATLAGLPEEVTVTKLEMSLIFQTRTKPSYGLPALNQPTLKNDTKYLPANPDYRIAIKADSKTKAGTNATYWSRVAPSNSSVSSVQYYDYTKNGMATATITRDLQIEHPDGKTYNSWKIDFPVWVADDYRTGTYTPTTLEDGTVLKGCSTFKMSEFGSMAIIYNNATPIHWTNDASGKTIQNYYNVFVRHRYTLSDNRVLIYDSWRTFYSPYLPASEDRMYYEN